MRIDTPVIGIPTWDWKRKLVKYMTDNPNNHKVPIKDFCYECSRHFEILSLFDENDRDFEKTEYYNYQIENGKKHIEVEKKIDTFHKLYKNIRKNGCKKAPIVTLDGCRLDGSHRLSVLLHLGIKNSRINVAKYNLCFSTNRESKILSQVSAYRKKVYGF
jgi:hypothetical protein